jgi:hypothetical protein
MRRRQLDPGRPGLRYNAGVNKLGSRTLRDWHAVAAR